MRHLRTGTNHVIAVTAIIILLVSTKTAAADDLEFVCIPQEAMLLMYEEWSFYFTAINNTASPIGYRPLTPDDQCIFYRISDAGGNVLDHPTLCTEYAPSAFGDLPAYDTARGYSVIVHGGWGPNVDSITGLATIRPGEYTVEFIWTYDPDGRALYNGSRFLYDTAHVTVVMPSGPDSLAMDMYVTSNADYRRVYWGGSDLALRRQAREEQLRRYLEIFESYPNSCFARMALEKVISSASGGDQPEFEGYRLSELTAIYVLRYPERPFAQAALRRLAKARFIPGSEKKRVLGKVAYTLDQSEIGRLAETLSIDPYEGRKRR